MLPADALPLQVEQRYAVTPLAEQLGALHHTIQQHQAEEPDHKVRPSCAPLYPCSCLLGLPCSCRCTWDSWGHGAQLQEALSCILCAHGCQSSRRLGVTSLIYGLLSLTRNSQVYLWSASKCTLHKASASPAAVPQIMVFFVTANQTAFAAELFSRAGTEVLEMHSRKSQAHRTRTADAFRGARQGIMFSSDVSARGVDYPDVTLVVQVRARGLQPPPAVMRPPHPPPPLPHPLYPPAPCVSQLSKLPAPCTRTEAGCSVCKL